MIIQFNSLKIFSFRALIAALQFNFSDVNFEFIFCSKGVPKLKHPRIVAAEKGFHKYS